MTGSKIDLKGHMGVVYDVTWHPGSETIATCSGDWTAMFWSISEKNRTAMIQDTNFIYCIDFTEDGKYIIMGNGQGCIRLHEYNKNPGSILTSVNHQSAVQSLHASGNLVVSGDRNGIM